MDFVLRGIILIVVVLCYYSAVVPLVGGYSARRLLQVVTGRFSFTSQYSTDEIDKTLRLSVASLLQVVFCGALISLTRQAVPLRVEPVLVVYGVLLGVGEASLGSFLGELAMRTAMKLAPRRVPSQTRDWLAMLKGGWMGLFLKTAQSAPLALVISLALLYVGVEETVFRGVIISFFLRLGPAPAFLISLTVFVAVQFFHMPSRLAAIFPALGALVIGTIHGLLFLSVPNLLPLVVAHFVFILTALV